MPVDVGYQAELNKNSPRLKQAEKNIQDQLYSSLMTSLENSILREQNRLERAEPYSKVVGTIHDSRVV